MQRFHTGLLGGVENEFRYKVKPRIYRHDGYPNIPVKQKVTGSLKEFVFHLFKIQFQLWFLLH